MKKLKLNIQKFASTNSTTHYNLSQYIATDKPTYLVDYNGDMLKIDTAIYNAMSKATDNETNIGTMNNLNTTEKGSLVGAINEVNTQVGTNTSNISQNTIDISANSTKIGSLVDLSTNYKTNLVGAVNEVNSKVGTLSSLDTTEKTNLVGAINEVLNYFNLDTFEAPTNVTTNIGTISYNGLNTARNSEGTLGKIYGRIDVSDIPLNSTNVTVTMQTAFRPTTDLIISSEVFSRQYGNNTDIVPLINQLTISTTGLVTITAPLYATTLVVQFNILPCLLFIKDFGDTPAPTI